MLALILLAQVSAAAPPTVPATPRTLSEFALERRLTGPRAAAGTLSVTGAGAFDSTATEIYRELARDAESRRAQELEAERLAEPVAPPAPVWIVVGGSSGGFHRRHIPRVRPFRPVPAQGVGRPWRRLNVRDGFWR